MFVNDYKIGDMKLDLSILFEKPERDKSVMLTIEPLAPLSIVSTLPGSYYKSLDKPTKANLCGMFENVLGWHIGQKDRSKILKKMKATYKKTYKIKEFDVETSAVGYTSLLGHLFEIELPHISPLPTCRYSDLWTQHLFRKDGYSHPKGTANLSYQLISSKNNLEKKDGKISDKVIGEFYEENRGAYPMYYSSPRKREFIVLENNYMFKLSMSSHLFENLSESINENNIAYLGTNEGWVNLKLEEL
jgi:CRISPR-associated protein Cas5